LLPIGEKILYFLRYNVSDLLNIIVVPNLLRSKDGKPPVSSR